MALPLSGKTNVTAPNEAYPYGDIKDNTGSNNGTPVNKSVYADIHQFFAKLFDVSGLTYNNVPDNFTNGFQYFNALLEIFGKNGTYNPTIGLFNGNTSVTLTGTNVANAYYKISSTTIQIYYSVYISTSATYNAIRLSFPPNINANSNNFGNSSAYKQSSLTYFPVITSVEQTGQGGGNGGIAIISYGGGDLSNAGNTTTIQGSVIFTKI